MSINLRKLEVDYVNGSYSLRPAGAGSNVRVLAADTSERHTVPTDENTGDLARYVVFSATGDFWALPILVADVGGDITSIAVPSADDSESAPYLNPVTWTLGGDYGEIILVSSDATIINMQFFM